MWQLVLSLVLILVLFSGLLILTLRQFSTLLGTAADRQAQILSTLLKPILNPPPLPVVEQEQPDLDPPAWTRSVDSVDLMETTRMLDWEMPEISDEDSISPEM